MISPPGLTAASAAAKPRQGCVSVHGLTSFPDDATNVRCGAAAAVAGSASAAMSVARATSGASMPLRTA